jgi:prepilin-type processing-associated H-X9-DG protein
MVAIDRNKAANAGKMELRKILDGTSKTVMVGEAWHDTETQDAFGALATGESGEPEAGNRKDHWFGGSDDIDTGDGVDLSEFLGSTGVLINLQKASSENQATCASAESPGCQALQLSFGSAHSGMCQMAFVDGHVESVTDDIDLKVWSDYGTRASQTLQTGDSTTTR